MPVDIEAAIREGFERTVARNGLLLVGIWFAIAVLNGVLAGGTFRTVMDDGPMPGMSPMAPPAPSVGVPAAAAGVLSLLLSLATLVVAIAAARVFLTDETERLPEEYFTRNIVLAGLNAVVGGFVFVLAVSVGLVLLVVPGLFLLVSLFFWYFYVAVEDQNFVEGFRNSWELTRGHRWRLLAIGVVVAIVNAVINGVFGIPAAFLPVSVGFIVAQLGGAFVAVFFLATAARTFVQLRALESTDEATAAGEPAAD